LEDTLSNTISETSAFLLSKRYLLRENLQNSNLINTLAFELTIGLEECVELINDAASVLTPDMNGPSCGYILRALNAVEKIKRQRIIKIVKEELLSEDMDGYDIGVLIYATKFMSDEQLEVFISRSREVIARTMKREDRLRNVRGLVRQIAGIDNLFKLINWHPENPLQKPWIKKGYGSLVTSQVITPAFIQAPTTVTTSIDILSTQIVNVGVNDIVA
jgi:hypothetical protein